MKWQRLVMIDLVVLEQRYQLRKSAEKLLSLGRDAMGCPTHLVIPPDAMEPPLIAAVSLGSFRCKIGSSSPKLVHRTHWTQTGFGIRKFAATAESFFHL